MGETQNNRAPVLLGSLHLAPIESAPLSDETRVLSAWVSLNEGYKNDEAYFKSH